MGGPTWKPYTDPCVCDAQVDLPMLPSLERNTQVVQHYKAA